MTADRHNIHSLRSVQVFKTLRAYLSGYCHFADSEITLPLSYWIAATYIFEAFDSYPYLVITAKVKRSGKTRLSELIGFTSNMPFNVAGATAPALFAAVKDNKPTVIWDEAEQLNSEANTLVRAFLNVGYRKGQTIPRFSKSGVIEWPTYCPKVFVLIGDVYDTLRDRSIIVEMQRGEPKERFSYEPAKSSGLEIADELKNVLATNLEKIIDAYNEERLSFLTDRDEEIWRPLFAICRVLGTEAEYKTMQRLAADMSADKTNPNRYRETVEADAKAKLEEYGRMLLRDVYAVTRNVKGNRFGKRFIPSAGLLVLLKAIPTSPWRKYHSETGTQGEDGLTMQTLSTLLAQYGVNPILCRASKVFRGYNVEQIETAAKKEKIIQ